MAALPVVLVGLRGAGKTTVGARLASALGLPFRDLDRDVEALATEPLAALLARDEPAFRALEARALDDALAAGPAVIATGGGVVLRAESRAALRRACVVWLRATPEACAARVAADPTPRPPLAPGGPLAEARALLAVRGPLYAEVARVTVDADGPPDEVLARILVATSRGVLDPGPMTVPPPPDLSSKQLSFLRSKAQRLEPAVKIGKDGVDDGFKRELGIALDRHELVKVRAGKQVVVDAAALASDVGAALVAKLGHVLVLYRPAAEPKLRLPT